MNSIVSKCIGMASLAMVGLSVFGAPITWQTPATTVASSDAQVSTTYSFRWAYTGGSAATVNTVAFAAGLNNTINNANIQVSGFSGADPATFNGGTSGTWNTLSAGYKSILTGAAYGGTGSATITLKNLAVGGNYRVQIWIDDSRAGGAGRTAVVTSSGGNSVTLDYNDSNALGGVGQFAIGTFVADATTQTFTITGSASSQLNAIQLREEASSMVWDAGAAPDVNWVTPSNWGLDKTPAVGDSLTFTITGLKASGTISCQLPSSAETTCYDLSIGGTASYGSNWHTLDLGGKTLTLRANMTVGNPGVGYTHNSRMANGHLVVNGTTMTLVRPGDGATDGGTHMIDWSGLNSVTATNLTTLAVASENSVRFGSGTWTWAGGTNTVRATTFNYGWGDTGSRINAKTINLNGETYIYADTLNIAAGYSSGTVKMQFGGLGAKTLALRNKAGTGRMNVNLSYRVYNGSGTRTTGIMDFSGGTVDALLGTLTMSQNINHADRAGYSDSSLIMSNGTVDVTSVSMSPTSLTGTGDLQSNPTIDIRGGIFRFGSFTVTAYAADKGERKLLLKGGTFSASGTGAQTIQNLTLLQFGDTAPRIVTLGEAGKGALTLNAATISVSNDVTLNTVVNTTLNNTLSGGGSLTKSGAATLKLNGSAVSSTGYTGATKVIGGTLALGLNGDVNDSSGCAFEPGCVFNVADKTGGYAYTKTLTAFGMSTTPVSVIVLATKALTLSASATLAVGIAPTAPGLNQPAIAVSGGTIAFASGASMTFTNRAAQTLTTGQYKLVTGVSGTTVPSYSSDEIKKYVSNPANQNVLVEIIGGDLVLNVVDAASQGASVTTFSSPAQGVLIRSSKLSATVASDGGAGTPSGTIQLWDAADSSGALASATLNGAGMATISLPPTVVPGTYQMYVQYMGDGDYLASFSATNTVRVTGDTATWTGAGGDANWGTGANWDIDSPNLESLKAVFTNAIGLDTSVTLETDKTIGKLVFGGSSSLPTPASWTITGNTLTLSDVTQPVVTVNAFASGKGVSVASSFVSTDKPFFKNGKGSITFDGSVNAIGLILDGGSVSLNGTLSGMAAANPLTFGLTDGSTNVSVLALANTATIQGGLKVQTASAATNVISVAAGQTLYLNNGVSVQSLSADVNKTAFAMTGGGALVVNAATADFIVGKDNNTDTQAGTYTADLRGLASFAATNDNFFVGYETASITYGSVGYSRLDLPDTASIKATQFGVSLGENSTAGNNEALLTLGSGTTVVNADTVYIGVGRPFIGQQGGEIRFRSSGTLKLRNKAGTGAIGSMFVGLRGDTSSSGSRAQRSGLLDTRGGSIDAQVSALTLGRDIGSTGNNSPYAQGEIIVDGTGSILTVTTLNLGVGTAWVVEPRGILSLTSGVVRVGTLNMNNDTKKGGRATLNLSGGSLTVTSAVNFDMAGTQIVNLNGGTLNLSGLNVGAFANAMETFSFTSGTLKNAGTNWTSLTLSGAGSKNWQQDRGTNAVMFGRILGSGTLQKQGEGKLSLVNTNANTGTLNVSVALQQGTLACLTANALPALTSLSAMAGTYLQFVPGIPLAVNGSLSGDFMIDLADGNSVGDLNPALKYDLILLGAGADVSGATFNVGSTLKAPWNVSIKAGKVVLGYAGGTMIRFR